MNTKQRVLSAAAGFTATAVAAGVLVLGGGAASADTTPPWEPDPQSVGTISFYDASGAQITSGRTDTAPFAAYAVGSAYPHAGDTFAETQFANPDSSSSTDNWYVEDVGIYDHQPVGGTPANIATLNQTHPVVKGGNFDQTLDGFESDSIISTTPGYQNVVQVRLRTATEAGTIAQRYDVADLSINPSAHTWTQIYPVVSAPTQTSTTLTATPNPASTTDSVTLTATESPATAGTVQFKDGAIDIGAPVAVDGTGKATTSSTFSSGTHHLSAVFEPASSSFSGSTGTTDLTVNTAVSATSTTLGASPNPATEDQSVTLTATESPATTGTVQFKDGSDNLGAPVAVDGTGKATITSTFMAGTHHLSAVFTPSSSDYSSSTGTTDLTVSPKAGLQRAVVTGVSPSSGSTAGGDTVTITGMHFTGATRVVFQRTRTTDFSIISDTEIVVTTPPHDKGVVQVRVHTTGLSAKNPHARYKYVPPAD